MKKRLIRLALTLCSLLFLSVQLNAQATYWGFNHNNTLGFMPGPTITGPGPAPISTPMNRKNINAHTIYDNSGQVLFTVNTEGIFDRSGSLIRATKGRLGIHGPAMYTINSEIEVFPNGTACGHYYVAFWTIGGPTPKDYLELIDVDASNPAMITTVDEPNLVNYSGPATNLYPEAEGSLYGIVAGKADQNGSRKLYALYMEFFPSFTAAPDTFGNYVIDCWEFNADGTYSLFSKTPLNWGGPIPHTYGIGDKMGLVSIMEATPDGEQIAWAGPKSLKVFSPASGTVTTYPVPALAAADGTITGVEWVPQMHRWYVSYQYMSGGTPTSTIGYFDEGITTVMNSAGGALSSKFGSSELEMGLDGNLYFASAPGTPLGDPAGDPTTIPGVLYTFSPYVATPTYTPVGSIQVKMSSAGGAFYYLNNQIDGEDHRSWETTAPSLVDHFDLNNNVGEPVSIPGGPCGLFPPIAPQIINVCANGLTLDFKNAGGFSVPLGFSEQYAISWEETDACGVPVPGSSYSYTGPWQYGSGPIDLSGAGFASPLLHGKYFVFTVKVRNNCATPVTEATWTKFMAILPLPDPFASWTISRDTNWVNPGDTCEAAPCSDLVPSIRLNPGFSDVSYYYVEVTDFGLSNCVPPISPVAVMPPPMSLILTSALLPGSTSPVFLPVHFSSGFYSGFTPISYSTAYDFFANNPDHLFGIRLHLTGVCRNTATTPMKYFRNCSFEGARLAAADLVSNCTVAPNPATDYIGLSFSAVNGKKCSAALYAVDGKLIQTLLPEQTATTNELSLKVPLGEVAPGIYFCKYSIDGVPGTTRIQVSR